MDGCLDGEARAVVLEASIDLAGRYMDAGC